MVLQKNRTDGKLLPKGKTLKLVGYENLTKGYRLYDVNKRDVIKSRDVIFFENSFEKSNNDNVELQDVLHVEFPKTFVNCDDSEDEKDQQLQSNEELNKNGIIEDEGAIAKRTRAGVSC